MKNKEKNVKRKRKLTVSFIITAQPLTGKFNLDIKTPSGNIQSFGDLTCTEIAKLIAQTKQHYKLTWDLPESAFSVKVEGGTKWYHQ